MLIEGEKWACASCIKGHRVSNCNHSDRPLTRIAPKGRPVKQCDHCRDARKAKSHHAKCDCGNKRTKDKAKNDTKSDDSGCCCYKGDACVCGIKSEASDLRLEAVLNRHALPVKSKPRLNSCNSESILTVFANGHHKIHKHNNLAHTSGAPYKVPHRPKSLHSSDSYHQARKSISASRSNSMDDVNMALSMTAGNFATTLMANGSHTMDADSSFMPVDNGSNDIGLGFMSQSTGPSSNTSTEDLSSTNFNNFNWLDTNLASVSEDSLNYSTSPTYQEFSGYDWTVPTAEANDYFSPADLPLMANMAFPEYAQPISHSGESGFRSVPTLTASSSGARSENGLQNEGDSTIVWTEPVQSAEANAIGQRAAGEFKFDMNDSKSQAVFDDLPSYSAHREIFARAHRLSDSTAVPDNMTLDTTVNTDMSSFENYPVFNAGTQITGDSSAFPNGMVTTEAELGSIMIPAGVDDDTRGWFYQTQPSVTNIGRIQQYGWLLDTQ